MFSIFGMKLLLKLQCALSVSYSVQNKSSSRLIFCNILLAGSMVLSLLGMQSSYKQWFMEYWDKQSQLPIECSNHGCKRKPKCCHTFAPQKTCVSVSLNKPKARCYNYQIGPSCKNNRPNPLYS